MKSRVKDAKIQFSFSDTRYRIREFDYWPGFPGTWEDPPDPSEIEVHELEWWDSEEGKWVAGGAMMLDELHEDDEFYTKALDAIETSLDEERGDWEIDTKGDWE